MAFFNDKFKKSRLDQSPYLFHLIKGQENNPKEVLQKILDEKKLRSDKHDFICFSASPITSILDFFNVKTKNFNEPLYKPWGLGFSRDILIRDYKARNVIYTDKEEKEKIPDYLSWRTDLLDVDKNDFEYLREWRIKGNTFDFSKIPPEEMIVIAPTEVDLNVLVAKDKHPFVTYNNINTHINLDKSTNECQNVEPERAYKGVSLETLIKEPTDDFTLSGSTITQVIGAPLK